MLLIDSGPTLDILDKVFQLAAFCFENVEGAALYRLKPAILIRFRCGGQ